MGGILYPVFQHQRMLSSQLYVAIERRFLGFVWMSVWTTAITGILLMLFSQHFIFGQYGTEWDFFLLSKQIIYLLMVGLSISTATIVKEMESIVETSPATDVEHLLQREHRRILTRRRFSLVLGMVVLLISARLTLG